MGYFIGGGYRDKSFISHDYDLDVGVLAQDYSENFDAVLMKYGFTVRRKIYIRRRNSVEARLVEVTYDYKDFSVDVSIEYSDGDNRRLYLICGHNSIHKPNEFEVHVYTHNFPYPLEKVYINGHVYNAPNSPEITLKNVYGETYMIPNPNWLTTRQYHNVEIMDFDEVYGYVEGKW